MLSSQQILLCLCVTTLIRSIVILTLWQTFTVVDKREGSKTSCKQQQSHPNTRVARDILFSKLTLLISQNVLNIYPGVPHIQYIHSTAQFCLHV